MKCSRVFNDENFCCVCQYYMKTVGQDDGVCVFDSRCDLKLVCCFDVDDRKASRLSEGIVSLWVTSSSCCFAVQSETGLMCVCV